MLQTSARNKRDGERKRDGGRGGGGGQGKIMNREKLWLEGRAKMYENSIDNNCM